jgi:hypothetical protein
MIARTRTVGSASLLPSDRTANRATNPKAKPPLLGALVRWWGNFLALTRLSTTAVCAQSAALGPHDFHNYRDDVDGVPWFTEGGARCKRCGKRYRL